MQHQYKQCLLLLPSKQLSPPADKQDYFELDTTFSGQLIELLTQFLGLKNPSELGRIGVNLSSLGIQGVIPLVSRSRKGTSQQLAGCLTVFIDSKELVVSTMKTNNKLFLSRYDIEFTTNITYHITTE